MLYKYSLLAKPGAYGDAVERAGVRTALLVSLRYAVKNLDEAQTDEAAVAAAKQRKANRGKYKVVFQ